MFEFDSSDSYYPHLGADKHCELKPPREEEMKALFEKKKSSEGETGGRNEEVYLRITIGTRIMRRLMKHLVETGMKPASFTTMFADNPNINDQEREALRRRSSSMVRTNPWDIWREELRLLQGQLPIGGSTFCAVTKKVRAYSGPLTLVKQGLLRPDQLMEQHEAKQQAAMKSERQMIAQTAHLDQEERERHMNYMRAIASGSQETPDAFESATPGASRKKKCPKAK